MTKGLAMPRNVIVRKRPGRERPSGSMTAILRRCRPETG
ncbi:protein of unassigned function [Methylobacterium oryzae CBMB20]|uniref:Protein of unassigned function n=1 Tax=Methylobacterium oryzae CBMB20 TaxID=693986 RepID=A0A089Q0N7_9HYPH|nr:protein of unassigned function [Methylobacterium oryzae CBMB20]